jgi:hypothetical protein
MLHGILHAAACTRIGSVIVAASICVNRVSPVRSVVALIIIEITRLMAAAVRLRRPSHITGADEIPLGCRERREPCK